MNAFKVINLLKIIIMVLFFGVNVFIVAYYLLWPSKYESQHNLSFEFDAQTYDLHDFNIDLNINRLNKLFKIIQSKENMYEKVLDKLNILQFKKLTDNTFDSDKTNWLYRFKKEIDANLEIEGSQVGVKEKFVDELAQMSKNFSFNSLHQTFPSRKIQTVIFYFFNKLDH
jgi:hypothetical protein